jgi:formylglycine-generating enzyme required for sulfatase activity
MGKYEVTVANFSRFVEETDYQTDAEKMSSYFWNGTKWELKAGVNWRFDAAEICEIARE